MLELSFILPSSPQVHKMFKLVFVGLLLIQQLLAEINYASRYNFATDLYNEIAPSGENFIFSPLSIQTGLALLYLGTGMHTEEELRNGLRLESYYNKTDVAEDYKQFLDLAVNNPSSKFKIANRLYVDEIYDVAPAFNITASNFFGAGVEKVKFTDAEKTADNINSWVESKTEHKIKNLVDPSGFSAETALVIVNALHFKAEWKYRFYTSEENEFYSKENEMKFVHMMERKKIYVKYADLPSLDATCVQLPYKDTNLSMVVVLPNKIEGLAELEQKLNKSNLKELEDLFQVYQTDVYLPKFQFDFGLSLVDTLKKMGMRTMFNDAADLTGILQTAKTLTVSEVMHKAFIAVGERGTEASAATSIQGSARMLSFDSPKVFRADHPFLFAIKDENAIYFMGHVFNPFLPRRMRSEY